MATWYKNILPRIKDVRGPLKNLSIKLSSIDGVDEVYVSGDYVTHIKNSNHRLFNVDIIAKCSSIFSEDLIAIDKNALSNLYTDNYLISQGYNPLSVRLSQSILKLSNSFIDNWVISKDNKILHYGPISDSDEDMIYVKETAKKYACKLTGSDDIQKATRLSRENWYKSYKNFINNYYEDMPFGWYTVSSKKSPVFKKYIKL